MTVEITLNKQHFEDYYALGRSGVYYDDYKPGRLLDHLLLSSVYLGLLLVTIGPNIEFDLVSGTCIGMGLGLILNWVIFVSIGTRVNKRDMAMILPDEDDPLLKTISFTFKDNRLEWQSETGGGHQFPDKFKKLFEDDQYLLIFRCKREAYVFPKDQLNSEQIDHIRNWASEHIPKIKIPHPSQS